MSATIVFGLGSNMGDSLAYLRSAVRALAPHYQEVRVSSVYRSAPVGGPPQPDFLNAVLVGQVPRSSELVAREALNRAHAIEASLDRTRQERWGPRTVDIDLVALGRLEVSTEDLVVPHPRAAERAFVLVPWAEVTPEFRIPGMGTVSEVLDALPAAEPASIRHLRSPTALGTGSLRSQHDRE